MKKLILTLIIFGLGLALAYASTGPMPQQVTITSGHTLTLTVPTAINYNLLQPTQAGDEEVDIDNPQTVTLRGNGFINTPAQPYITIYMTGTVPNASMSLRSVAITTIGTVSAQSTTAEIILSGTPANYAIPDKVQSNAYGTVTGSHQVWITKGVGGVSGGSHPLMFMWTGYDAGT